MDCTEHDYVLQDMRMSTRDPPKAYYEYRCYECGNIVEGLAEDIASEIPEVKSDVNGDGEDIPEIADVKEAYVKGKITDDQMEKLLNKLHGLDN